jgi:hypothetical protein
MKMLAVFGQLLHSAKEKLKKKDESSGTTDTGQVPTTETVTPKTLIWGVMDGPYNVEDFPEEDLDYMGIEEGYEWMLVCKIEEAGAVGLANFWYQTLDEALAVKYYFDSNIEPLEIDSD